LSFFLPGARLPSALRDVALRDARVSRADGGRCAAHSRPALPRAGNKGLLRIRESPPSLRRRAIRDPTHYDGLSLMRSAPME
jgi:hypothetical protein